MSDNPLRIAGVTGDSIVDGPGLRLAVFVQGCSRRCEGCHNPGTWDPAGGSVMDEETLWQRLTADPLQRGVTLTGGEPFEQAAALLPFVRRVRAAGRYDIASYSGYTFEELLAGTPAQRELLSLLDVLIDGPFILAQRSLELRFRGSRNQRILSVPASLAAGQAVWEISRRWVG